MTNSFEQLKTVEDFNNFLFALIGDAAEKGIEFNTYDPEFDQWNCWSYEDEECFYNHIKFE